MYFKMPVKVYMESGCVKNHAAEITAAGNAALIITGRHSAKACGALDDVREVLKAAGKNYAVFNGVEENPSRETIMKGRTLGLEMQADFVIAIGGGSPMDAGKAIALMIAQPEEGIDYLYSKQSSFKSLPVICIPTTCGTGSEVTGVSVLTNTETGKKGSIPFKIYPILALLDEKYLHSLSHGKLCDTAVDALAHLMESYMCASASKFSRVFVKEGLQVFGRCCRALAEAGQITDEDYSNLLYASVMGGMAIAHTGTTIPHAMSYPATVEAGIPHGRACGYYLTGYLRECGETGCRLLPQMAGFTDIDEMENFLYNILVMNTDEIPEPLRRKTAEEMAVNTGKLKTSAVPVTKEMLYRIAKVK